MMLDSVLQTILEYHMLTRGERVVCGLSGGADSVAMLRALCLLRERLGISVAAAHFNHGLRGAESERDAQFSARLCEEFGVEYYMERASLSADTPGVEARAREARYAFFTRAKERLSAQKIATAHHAGDNLETMLFHLARGSGLRGLSGIPPVRGDIIRPLLFTEKEEIVAFLQREKLCWVEDSSNGDEALTRNLIRMRIVPLLREVHPDAVRNSARCAKTLRQDEEALDDLAREWLSRQARALPPPGSTAPSPLSPLLLRELHRNALPVSAGTLPDAVCARVIQFQYKKIFENRNQDLDFSHICAIMNLLRQSEPTGGINISRHCYVRRAGAYVYFVDTAARLSPIPLQCGESVVLSGYRITCRRGTVIVRARRDGDRIKLAGRRTRLIKKIFCDAKIPLFLRDRIPVIERDGRLIAVCGFGFAEGYDNGGVLIEFDA